MPGCGAAAHVLRARPAPALPAGLPETACICHRCRGKPRIFVPCLLGETQALRWVGFRLSRRRRERRLGRIRGRRAPAPPTRSPPAWRVATVRRAAMPRPDAPPLPYARAPRPAPSPCAPSLAAGGRAAPGRRTPPVRQAPGTRPRPRSRDPTDGRPPPSATAPAAYRRAGGAPARPPGARLRYRRPRGRPVCA